MKKSFLLFVFLIVFFVPSVIFASEIIFVPVTAMIAKGELLKVNVYVLSGEDRINAVEGKVVFQKELLEVSKISYGNSILSFWPQIPVDQGEGVIAFSGVTPGGYASAERGLLFSVIFKTLQEGSAMLELKNGLVLRDDGAGSPTNLKVSNSVINITKNVTKQDTNMTAVLNKELDARNDHELPESFTPLVGSNPNIFDGKYFLVFSTVDKQSGLDHYEVQESARKTGDDTKWIRADSPYLLTDQTLRSFIIVKALDKAGNYRIENLDLGNTQKFYQSVTFWVIIILILFMLFYFRRRYKKS